MTYLELKQNIAYQRLNRPDLLTPIPPSPAAIIPTYVLDRIGYYQKACFQPSEQLDYSITAIPGQSTYSLRTYPNLKATQNIVKIRLLLNTIWIPLTRVDWYQDILDADVLNPPFQTIPSYWATYNATIRLYPTPNLPYPLELMSNLSPPAPVADTDVNFWTAEVDENGAASLIIRSACAEICREFLNDIPRAEQFQFGVAREAQSLFDLTGRMRGPSQTRPYL